MAKVNQNKLIGGLAVAVITLLVVIVIVVIAQELFPANSRNSSSTVLGTNTNQLFTAAPVTTTTAAATTTTDPYPEVTTTPPPQGGDAPQVTTPAPSVDNVSGQTVYLTSSVYLRAAASWSSDKGSVIKKGQSAKVIRVEGNWYVLEYNGEQGYVAKDYVSLTAPSGDAPTE